MPPANENEKTGEANTSATAPAKAAEPRKRTLLDALRNGETVWSLRFKGIRGVQDVLILASDPVKAEHVGRAWVNSQPGRMYLSVAPAIVADESILASVTAEVVGAGAVGKR